MSDEPAFRRTVALVALANLAYFGFEFFWARRIGSVALMADSIDFLEDASLNLLVLLGLALAAPARARLGVALAGLLLVPSAFAAAAVVQKLLHPAPPAAPDLGWVALGALAVNLACAFALARFRRESGSLAKAAFLSSRNDALANVAMIVAAGLTALTLSHWPDLAVGVGVFAMNADAAFKVYRSARSELAAAEA